MKEYEYSEFVESIANELIAKHPAFAEIREVEPVIYYQVANFKKGRDRITYGDCERAKDKLRAMFNCDYVITIYLPSCENFSLNQWKALIFHELLHIDCRRDDDDVLTRRIRPHNLQDFYEVTDKLGTHWVEDPDCPDIMEGIE